MLLGLGSLKKKRQNIGFQCLPHLSEFQTLQMSPMWTQLQVKGQSKQAPGEQTRSGGHDRGQTAKDRLGNGSRLHWDTRWPSQIQDCKYHTCHVSSGGILAFVTLTLWFFQCTPNQYGLGFIVSMTLTSLDTSPSFWREIFLDIGHGQLSLLQLEL